jgi:plastocyanin
MRRTTKGAALTAAVAALVAGGVATAALGGGAGSKAPRVKVTLEEFKIGLSTTKLSPGKVTLAVADKGSYPHQLAVSGPGVNTRTPLTVTLKKGSYRLWCPVGSHASMGMKLTLKVGANGGGTVTPAPVTPPPATTTTGGGGGGYDDPGGGY